MMTSMLTSTMSKVSRRQFAAVKPSAFRYMSHVVTLEDRDVTEDFRQLNHKSVLYFTAAWCGPCKAIKPVYEDLAAKYTDVAFGKVDVDENPESAAEFNITAVPTFVFSDMEEEIERFSGADASKLDASAKALNDR